MDGSSLPSTSACSGLRGQRVDEAISKDDRAVTKNLESVEQSLRTLKMMIYVCMTIATLSLVISCLK